MTPKPPARSRLTARTLIATGALLAAASVGTAAADAVHPDAPGTGGEHFAGARIAAVEWCGTGVVGDLNSDRSEGPATARWAPPEESERSDGPGGVAGEQHFPEAPEAGISRVTAGRDTLAAEAAVSGVHFSPSCALVRDGTGEAGSAGGGALVGGPHTRAEDEDLAAVFGADDLVVVGKVESQAQWTRERGATARLEVQDLHVLGHEVEIGAGTYERTFTASGPNGPVEVDFTARAAVTELPDGQPGATTASAGLDMEFDVTSPAEEGEEPELRTYRLELAGTSVHSERAVQSGPEPQQEETPEPDDDLSPGVPPNPGGGSDGGDGGSDGRSGEGGSDGRSGEGGQNGQGGQGGQDGREGENGQGGDDGRQGENGVDPGDGNQGEDGDDGDRGGNGGAGGSPDGSQDGSPGSGSSPGNGDGDGRGDTGDGPSPDPTRTPDAGSRGTPGRDDVTIDPQGSEPRGGLPVTGTAILGMVAAGGLSLAGGGAALYLGRTRRSAEAEN